MKIIKPYHKQLDRNTMSANQFIELIGRTCYKSTDKITEDSANTFVTNLFQRKHLAMLEHETAYFVTSKPQLLENLITFIHTTLQYHTKFFNITILPDVSLGILSGNLTAFYHLLNTLMLYIRHVTECNEYENIMSIYQIYHLLRKQYPIIFKQNVDLFVPAESTYLLNKDSFYYLDRPAFMERFQPYPEEPNHPNHQILYTHLTHTALFVCDRGISHELVRHRPCSFGQESTRYCNYQKDKFGNEITVIEPFFFVNQPALYEKWKHSCQTAEEMYLELLALNASPQETRSVLPNSLKTEIVLTCTEKEWQHIVNLRALSLTGAAHPQMVELMMPWYEELKTLTYNRIE